MRYLFLGLLFIANTVYSQSLTLSTHSFKVWGAERGMVSASISYQDVSFHVFNKEPFTYYGVSYKPLSIKDIVKGGIIAFNKRFLFGTRVNALIEVGYTFSFGRIAYRHISNANFGEYNWGADNITLTIPLH